MRRPLVSAAGYAAIVLAGYLVVFGYLGNALKHGYLSLEAAQAMSLFVLMTVVVAGGWWQEIGKRRILEQRLRELISAQDGFAGLPVMTNTPIPANHNFDRRRIDQIETQIDQMAQQMDRLVESQEFLSRVLADRVERPDPRLRTPH